MVWFFRTRWKPIKPWITNFLSYFFFILFQKNISVLILRWLLRIQYITWYNNPNVSGKATFRLSIYLFTQLYLENNIKWRQYSTMYVYKVSTGGAHVSYDQIYIFSCCELSERLHTHIQLRFFSQKVYFRILHAEGC